PSYLSKDRRNRTQDNLTVDQEGLFANVLQTEPVLFCPYPCHVHAMRVLGTQLGGEIHKANGGEIGDPRPYRQNEVFLFGVLGRVLFDLRTGSNDAHLASKDVQELGQLVELVLANEVSDSSDSNIGDLCRRSLCLRTGMHCAEFIDSKG